MRDRWIAWAVGYIDGEGYAYLRPSGSVGIEVASINPASLVRLQDLFGGTVEVASGRHRQAYRWRIYGAAARACARTLLETELPTVKFKQLQAVARSKDFPKGSARYEALVRAAKLERDAEHLNILDERSERG